MRRAESRLSAARRMSSLRTPKRPFDPSAASWASVPTRRAESGLTAVRRTKALKTQERTLVAGDIERIVIKAYGNRKDQNIGRFSEYEKSVPAKAVITELAQRCTEASW